MDIYDLRRDLSNLVALEDHPELASKLVADCRFYIDYLYACWASGNCPCEYIRIHAAEAREIIATVHRLGYRV